MAGIKIKDTMLINPDHTIQTANIFIIDEKIAHIANQRISIDLDDGVKHNYELFKDVLAPLK